MISRFIVLVGVLVVFIASNQPAVAFTYDEIAAFNYNNQGPYTPRGGLMQASDGNFYGVLTQGGTNNYGAVYKMTPAGVVTILHHCSYALGGSPECQLVEGDDGALYGTAPTGGDFGYGTIFRVTKTGQYSVIASMSYGFGGYPRAGLLKVGTNYYGLAEQGGPAEYPGGIIYKFSTNGVVKRIGAFDRQYSEKPGTPLTLASDGNIYGATYGLDSVYSGDHGTIFKIAPDDTITTVGSVDGTNGKNIVGRLHVTDDGTIYGCTAHGGVGDYGTVFKMSSDGTVTLVKTFDTTSGTIPAAGLMKGPDGNLYGTCQQWGSSGRGTLFKVTASDVFSVVVNFTDPIGSRPYGELIVGQDGNLYGTTSEGGVIQGGNVFRISGLFASPPSAASLNIARAGGNAIVSWASQSGRSYELQTRTNLSNANWTTLANVTATGTTTSHTNAISAGANFFRLISLP